MLTQFNVLILDHSANDNDYIPNLMETEGLPVNVQFEMQPGQALEYLRKVSPEKFPNVILVDVYLPVMSGLEWAEYYLMEFYLQHPETRIYMVSNAPERSKTDELADNPVISGYVSKPITKALFEEAIFNPKAARMPLAVD